MSTPNYQVRHQPAASRFEVEVEGRMAVADYEITQGVMVMTHTVVPRALEGRGIAATLVAAALDWARTEGLKVRPVCSYVQAYMQRHPQTLDLLAGR